MILGIGIDIVHIDRMKKWLVRPLLVQRYFHPSEIDDAEQRGVSMHLSLAARFAAKEAFGKALGTGLMGISLREIQVENNHNGKPDIRLYGRAKAAFEKMGGRSLHLSLTHERDNAVAVVIIEK